MTRATQSMLYGMLAAPALILLITLPGPAATISFNYATQTGFAATPADPLASGEVGHGRSPIPFQSRPFQGREISYVAYSLSAFNAKLGNWVHGSCC